MTEQAARIGWIRHGITEWNGLGKIQGVTDIPLNAEGKRQAQRLADRLAGEGGIWHGIACSDLTRAVQTAEILAQRLGIPMVRDSRLRERYFGAAEGTTHEERLARWGENWRRLVPDQESDESVLDRGLSFVQDLLDHHPGEAWLAVTHGSFLTRILHKLVPQLDDAYILNVSLTIIEKRENGWIPLLHNCTAHLVDESANANS